MSREPTENITSLSQAVDYYRETMAAHPERDMARAEEAALAGERRKHPVLRLGLQRRTDDPDTRASAFDLPIVDAPPTPEGNLARGVIGLLGPLKLLNPVSGALGPGGMGTGTLAVSFGIELNEELDNTPAFTRRIAEVLADDPPCPETSGLLGRIHERVDLVKGLVPGFRIAMPDMQGPFNLAHAICGEEALAGPYADPDGFRRLMDRITDFWIAVRRNLVSWIGEDRLGPAGRIARIAECSVNLISRSMYEEHVLPCDLRIAEAFGPLDIHTCSGPHVFHATLERLPEVAVTEAGLIARTAAGCTPVDEALEAVAGLPVALRIGQELPDGEEFEFVARDLDRYEVNPRLLFGYTGMHWWNRDAARILDVHRRLDDYWAERYG